MGNNGESGLTDLKSFLAFGIAYGAATTIAVKTIDWVTSARTKKDGHKDANSTGISPSTCNIIFPNAVFCNATLQTSSCSNKSNTQNKPTATATAAASTSKERAGVMPRVLLGITEKISHAKSPTNETAKQAQSDHYDAGLKKPRIPAYCVYIMDFYTDCNHGNRNKCGGYREVVKRCHEAGVASGDSPAISHPPLDPDLLFMSYQGCRERNRFESDWKGYCKHYSEYMKKANALLE